MLTPDKWRCFLFFTSCTAVRLSSWASPKSGCKKGWGKGVTACKSSLHGCQGGMDLRKHFLYQATIRRCRIDQTLIAKALSKLSIALSGSPKFSWALPRVIQAWRPNTFDINKMPSNWARRRTGQQIKAVLVRRAQYTRTDYWDSMLHLKYLCELTLQSEYRHLSLHF